MANTTYITAVYENNKYDCIRRKVENHRLSILFAYANCRGKVAERT